MDITAVKNFILNKLEKELSGILLYHNVEHVKDVYETVLRHVEAGGINEKDALLLKTAALFHDSGFIVQADGHEEISCSYAKEYLPGFGYSNAQINTICGMIRATKIPQTPHTPLEEIMADADLDYLGRDDFFKISNNLYLELKSTGVVNDEEQWNRIQANFFDKHHYFTETARKWRAEKKAEHLAAIKYKLTATHDKEN